MSSKKRLIISIVILLVTIIAATASTFAFFEISKNNEKSAVAIQSKILELHFDDSPEILVADIYPGATIIKTFSVTNTGDNEIAYSIYLKDVINQFSRKNDVVISLTSTNDGATLTNIRFPSTDKSIAENIIIPSGVTQEYTMSIHYINTVEDQNEDMNKMISGVVQIEEYNPIF